MERQFHRNEGSFGTGSSYDRTMDEAYNIHPFPLRRLIHPENVPFPYKAGAAASFNNELPRYFPRLGAAKLRNENG